MKGSKKKRVAKLAGRNYLPFILLHHSSPSIIDLYRTSTNASKLKQVLKSINQVSK
jgi:hypothetical protein